MEGGAPGPLMQLVPFVAIFAIFYFLMIAPMRKRQKALQQMIQNLKKGDAVITQGGLYGEVVSLKDDKVRVARSAISGMQGQEGDGGANPS